MNRSRIAAVVAATLLSMGLAACDGATGPSAEARVDAVVHGDAPARSQDASGTGGEESGSVTGTLEVRARVFVQSEGGAWSELTGRHAARQTVGLSSASEGRLLVSGRVAADRYTKVRVVFEDVRASVTGGLELGAGLLQGEIRVSSQGGTTVEREVRFEATSGGAAQLVIDLNAQAWLRRADASSRAVAEATFSSAVEVRVR
jgi:hypothetical protein